MEKAEVKKKELEDKIIAFVRDKIYHEYLGHSYYQRPQYTTVREIYLGVDAGSYGAADVFNSVIREMDRAGIIVVQQSNRNVVSLSDDQDKEMYNKARSIHQ